jgi:hypothetical protein
VNQPSYENTFLSASAFVSAGFCAGGLFAVALFAGDSAVLGLAAD